GDDRRPGAHAVIALVGRGARLAVIARAAVVRGLPAAAHAVGARGVHGARAHVVARGAIRGVDVGALLQRLVARANEARAVRRRAAFAGRAHVVDGAEQPVIAGRPVVLRHRLAAGLGIADAHRARAVEHRAVDRRALQACPARARAPQRARVPVVALGALVA